MNNILSHALMLTLERMTKLQQQLELERSGNKNAANKVDALLASTIENSQQALEMTGNMGGNHE